MIYCFDIDGTICTNTFGEYEKAKPYEERIRLINKLYEEGNIIKLFTARGSTTKINWRSFTETQLEDWGVSLLEMIMVSRQSFHGLCHFQTVFHRPQQTFFLMYILG